MTRPTCKTCPFFADAYDPASGDWDFTGDGECRLVHPVVDSKGIGQFPVVTKDGWCGEHPDFPVYMDAIQTPGTA